MEVMAMLATLKKKEGIVFILTMLAIVLAAIASNLYWTRADLSSSRAHTLSMASRNLHKEIPETVRISYYASKILADRHPGPGAIEDFLRELEAVSRGRIRVRVIDPTKNPAEPESFGLTPQSKNPPVKAGGFFVGCSWIEPVARFRAAEPGAAMPTGFPAWLCETGLLRLHADQVPGSVYPLI